MNHRYPYQTMLKPYHAREALPLVDVAGWIRTAQEGQSIIVKDGPVSGLPSPHRDQMNEWEADGLITYAAIKASPSALSSDPWGWRVHVTRTEAMI